MSKLKHVGRLCPDCRNPVPNKAKVCPTCRGYLDWRRYIGIGQTNLALLVAAFSVLTTLISVGVPWFHRRGPEIKFAVESLTDDKLTLLARNDGAGSGIFKVEGVDIIVKNISGKSFGDTNYMVFVFNDGLLIEPGKESRVVAQVSNKRNLSEDLCFILKRETYFDRATTKIEQWALDGYNGLSCNLRMTETGLDASIWTERSFPCTQLRILSQCVFGYTLQSSAK